MVGRLLKYESKCGLVVFPLLWAGIIVLFFAAKLCDRLNVPLVAGFLAVAIGFLTIGSLLFATVLPVIRYYQSLYGKEGYLVQTLPVSKGKILLSKYIFAAISYLCALVSLGLVFGLLALVGGQSVKNIASMLYVQTKPMLWYTVVAAVIQAFETISLLYFAITLANTSRFIKHNIAYAVVIYIVGNFVAGLVNLAAMMGIPMVLDANGESARIVFKFYYTMLHESWQYGSGSYVMGLGSIFSMLLIGGILAMLTEKLMHKANVK